MIVARLAKIVTPAIESYFWANMLQVSPQRKQKENDITNKTAHEMLTAND